MFRRLLRAIFRGIFKPNFLLSWPSVLYVVQLLFRGSFRWPLPHCRDSLLVSRVRSVPHLPCVYGCRIVLSRLLACVSANL
jgi:hypothetical protein